MKEGDIIPVALELTVRYKESSAGLIVGFFREFPFITGQAKTNDDLVNQLQYDLMIYFNTFPEGQKKLEQYGRVVENSENISNKNIKGEIAPALKIEKPEIGSDETWQETKTMLLPA